MKTKNWYESKVLWIAIAQGIFGVLVVMESQMPGAGWILILKSILDGYLRITTNTKLG